MMRISRFFYPSSAATGDAGSAGMRRLRPDEKRGDYPQTGRWAWGLVAACALALFPIAARAQKSLDGFDPRTNGTVWAVAVQADGKILVGGGFTTLAGAGGGDTVSRSNIGRLNADGSVDTGFNPGTNGRVHALTVQPDGKILVAGEFTMLGGGGTGGNQRSFIARLNPDGTLDQDFDPGANYGVWAMALQPDGKIVVGGSFNALGGVGAGTTPRKYIGRLNPDGSIDKSFDPGATGNVWALAVQPNGGILVGGEFTGLGDRRGATERHFIGRIENDGTLDMHFDPGANGVVYALALQPDGKILAGGNFSTLGGGEYGTVARNHIGRINVDGSIDADFNPGAGSEVYTLGVQQDGKILVGGSFSTLGVGSGGAATRNFIGRLMMDGSLDEGFDPGANSKVYAITTQADGKILVGGAFSTLGGGIQGSSPRSRLGRLYPDGCIDSDFDPGADDRVNAIAIQADGKILIGGAFTALGGSVPGFNPRNRIGRLEFDGSQDSGFNPGADGTIHAIAVQPDGKILVGGSFTSLGEGDTGRIPRSNLGRLNPDGSLDAGFDPGANGAVRALTVQADGKILVAGEFTTLGGGGSGTNARYYIGRLNPDGSIDTGFNPGADNPIFTLAVQPDGKIIAAGAFTNLGGGTGTTLRRYIGRFLPDGSLDAGFDPGANERIYALALQANGQILAGGEFSALGGGGMTARRFIGRLDPDGSLDSNFEPGANGPVMTLAVQADGKILIGGTFTTLGGGGTGIELRHNIGRLNADGSLDGAWNPGANGTVLALAIQRDGKVLVGGDFARLGGGATGVINRRGIGRLSSVTNAEDILTVDSAGSKITWHVGGAGPELNRVGLEFSTDGTSFQPLGAAARVGGSWELSGLRLPMAQTVFIRARGYYATGANSGSGSIAEALISTTSVVGIFAQIAAGGSYETVLTGINTGPFNEDVLVALTQSNGEPFATSGGNASEPVQFSLPPMGSATFPIQLAGETMSGYGIFSGNVEIDGTALFKSMQNGLVLSEAGVGLSQPTRKFTVYIDNTDNAATGYAVANLSSSAAVLNLTLREAKGGNLDHTILTLQPGRHLAEFAYERFKATAPAGFEGSIEFTSSQNVAAVALRYDNTNLNPESQVFSTIPVLVDESSTTIYFPQVADGAGYRTNFILVNPSETTGTTAQLEFYDDNGQALYLSIGGTLRAGYPVELSARGVARLYTDGTSEDLKVGWVRVRSQVPILGSSIFQIRSGNQIRSEAGVASSALTDHFTTYVESTGSTWSGVAICNPNGAAVSLTLNLRRSNGEIYATATETLPAEGHIAKFFTYPSNPPWFADVQDFEGTLEIIATEPVSAVALRYDNPQHNVFATLPVVILR